MPRRRREDSDKDSDSDDLDDANDYDWAPEGSKPKAKACTATLLKRAYQAPSSKRATTVLDSPDEDFDSDYELLRRANMKRNALVFEV